MQRRGPYAKGTAKRAEILDVALEVVAELGCRSASNREISRRVGLSQPGLVHYFGSREEMFMAVLRARDERDNAEYWEKQPDFEGILRIISHNAEVKGLVQLYIEFSAEASVGRHPAHEFFIERSAWVRQRFTRAIEVAQETGEFGDQIDIDPAVDILIAAADGLQQQWLLDPSVDMTDRLRRLWNSLAAASKVDAGEAAPRPEASGL